ncbi:MAG: hypothetical protein P4M12_04750 [Gammaproteobacteria bacterium]|nr:hypothetical protein [Gammaproteobacteria bacterium]
MHNRPGNNRLFKPASSSSAAASSSSAAASAAASSSSAAASSSSAAASPSPFHYLEKQIPLYAKPRVYLTFYQSEKETTSQYAQRAFLTLSTLLEGATLNELQVLNHLIMLRLPSNHLPKLNKEEVQVLNSPWVISESPFSTATKQTAMDFLDVLSSNELIVLHKMKLLILQALKNKLISPIDIDSLSQLPQPSLPEHQMSMAAAASSSVAHSFNAPQARARNPLLPPLAPKKNAQKRKRAAAAASSSSQQAASSQMSSFSPSAMSTLSMIPEYESTTPADEIAQLAAYAVGAAASSTALESENLSESSAIFRPLSPLHPSSPSSFFSASASPHETGDETASTQNIPKFN